ncbi:DnaJ domain-containing protein [Polaromonas sp.]|uniref:DnaJ domain-containing protein n=1 Tax=Polaromonas sp. TaxID=1869339 RepID=UPI003C90B85F
MKFKDHYTVMGVARNATPDDIKHAYRRLARKYHPDVSEEKNAEAYFKAVAQAYEVLRSPEQRAAYDRHDTLGAADRDFRPAHEWRTHTHGQRPEPADLLNLWVTPWVAAWEMAWAALRVTVPAPR